MIGPREDLHRLGQPRSRRRARARRMRRGGRRCAGRRALRRPDRRPHAAARVARGTAHACHSRQQPGRPARAAQSVARERRAAALPRPRRAPGAGRTKNLPGALPGVRVRDGLHRELGPGVLRSLPPGGRRARRDREGRQRLARPSRNHRRPLRACDLGAGRSRRDALRGIQALYGRIEHVAHRRARRRLESKPLLRRRRPMFTNNPFAALGDSWSPLVMQVYIVLMIVLVAAGTLFDIVHKGSARYFLNNWRKTKSKHVDAGEFVSIAVKTAVVDVLASGEFCNARRRVAHLLTMYGFLLYVISTAVMVFSYSTASIWPQLWWLGGLMILVGGYWFWFFIRADVAAEGNSPFRVMHADLFILSLLASVTLGLIWAYLQTRASAGANVFFGLYIIATTVLFASVPWSKFAHMFFKPAAAFEKRVSYANGTRSNLPGPADKPEQFGSAHEQPRHY